VVFLASFLAVFLAIYLTPSPYLHERAYSMPAYEWSSGEIDTGNHIAPSLNATDVPLDTTIRINIVRPMKIGELQLSPDASIARRENLSGTPAWVASIFYFSEPLKPATTYNATIFVNNKPISWNFTTTAEPYHPRYESMPSELGMYATVIISAVMTSAVGLIVWKKKTNVNTSPKQTKQNHSKNANKNNSLLYHQESNTMFRTLQYQVL
jgi:hypothetical protein